MFHGVHGEFRWLESAAHSIQDVLGLCPELVTNKGMVVTSFDSGPLVPSDDELRRGWRLKGSVLHIPSVEAVPRIPHEIFDEWYIFPSAPPQREFAVFVNYDWFTLGPAIVSSAQSNSRWDLKRMQRLFWQLLETAAPESYLACRKRLIFATRNGAYFSTALRGLAAVQKARTGSA